MHPHPAREERKAIEIAVPYGTHQLEVCRGGIREAIATFYPSSPDNAMMVCSSATPHKP